MTLNEALLQKLANWRPSREGRQTLLVPDQGEGWAVTVVAERHDEMSTTVWEMMLTRNPAPARRRQDDLKDWAYRVTSKVTGLLEPLNVIEVDAPGDRALLRSQEPTRRSGELYYYEVLLTGTSQATARRYRAQPNGGQREQIPFTLTHEVLAKFAADLSAA